MTETAVMNASPLIFLSRGGRLELLRHFADRVLIPKPVALEVEVRGPEDRTVRALREHTWLETTEPPPIPEFIQNWSLGPGESSVLALAVSLGNAEVIMDDLAGRKCALALGLVVRGTLGLVLKAKQRGLIPSARSVMETLLAEGLYLSRPILEAALKRVGE
ncbi:MAG: DUF3368 domain-containing protein [Kiritimatiellae bacterium]|nr:DUF3368 domain-containing protein [Kiritimatiellia bacterium]